MFTIGNVIEVCNVINRASSELTMLLGEYAELRLITPELPGVVHNHEMISELERDLLVLNILSSVAEQYMVSVTQIKGSSHTKPLPDARKASAFMLSKYVTNIKDAEIGAILKMDRTSALYNRNQAEEMLGSNKDFRFQYSQALTILKQSLKGND